MKRRNEIIKLHIAGSAGVRELFPEGDKMVKGYCVKCRIKQDMSNITETTLKNNRPAFYGNCPVCKTKMFRIGSLADAKKKADDTAAP
jgi:hypothetical protein